MRNTKRKLLEVARLDVDFDTPEGMVPAVAGMSFELSKGETLGIVGESGSGKSQTVLAIMGLLAANGRAAGSVRFGGGEILNLPVGRMNRIRGEKIAMIFQDPMTSLNPYLTVATQMTEVLVRHKNMSMQDARKRSIELLDAVHIPAARERIDMYPHEFSGGMRQRVMIAMALSCSPKLLIADEPTTALDVTVQAQILSLLGEVRREFGTSIILITHDLGVIAGVCDRVMVMYAGRVMEYGSVDDIFYRSVHPYTRGLLRSVPRLDMTGGDRLPTIDGNPPNLLALPKGCPFVTRCQRKFGRCETELPELREIDHGRGKACHLETMQ